MNLGQVLHIGSGGSLSQASDDAGGAMFEQNAGSGRPKWDDLLYTDLTKQWALASMPYFGADTVSDVQAYVAPIPRHNGGGGSDQCVQDGGDTLGGTCHAIAP